MWNKIYEDRLASAVSLLESMYGNIILQTDVFTLDYSSYYKREMGEDLLKKFVALDCIIHKSKSVEIKRKSMELEEKFKLDGRTVNIDPVLVDEYQVVALSKKDRGSRIYIAEGVYAEMELFYHHKTFHPFVWTYIDYKQNIDFFKKVRRIYLDKVKIL